MDLFRERRQLVNRHTRRGVSVGRAVFSGPGLLNVTTIQRYAPKSQALPIRFPPSRNNRHRSSQRAGRWRICNGIPDNPATSSGSVSNQAVQNYCNNFGITATAVPFRLGADADCATPYLKRTKSWEQALAEYSYPDPVGSPHVTSA